MTNYYGGLSPEMVSQLQMMGRIPSNTPQSIGSLSTTPLQLSNASSAVPPPQMFDIESLDAPLQLTPPAESFAYGTPSKMSLGTPELKAPPIDALSAPTGMSFSEMLPGFAVGGQILSSVGNYLQNKKEKRAADKSYDAKMSDSPTYRLGTPQAPTLFNRV